jgi:hypothetical protein
VRTSWYRKKTAFGEAGIPVRNKGKQERQIQTTQGVLNVRWNVLKVLGDGTEGRGQRNREILPLDDYLRITGLPFKMSPQMMAETVFVGIHESSLASAEQMIREYLPTAATTLVPWELTK